MCNVLGLSLNLSLCLFQVENDNIFDFDEHFDRLFKERGSQNYNSGIGEAKAVSHTIMFKLYFQLLLSLQSTQQSLQTMEFYRKLTITVHKFELFLVQNHVMSFRFLFKSMYSRSVLKVSKKDFACSWCKLAVNQRWHIYKVLPLEYLDGYCIAAEWACTVWPSHS